jgi:hypothetical protein
MMAHRRLFIPSLGYLAGGPAAMERDDEIWIVPGSQLPFLLRKVGSTEYQMILPAYLHGIMQGDALKDLDMPLELIDLV